MLRSHPHQLRFRLSRGVLRLLLLGLGTVAGAAQGWGRAPAMEMLATLPGYHSVREAWRAAESYAASIPEGDVMVGSGDSMLPLFPNRTVIVLQRMAMNELRSGMTVVFIGDRGRPVAHTLVNKTARGWRVKGLANDYFDRTLVRSSNYLGTVIRAYTPAPGA